MEKRKYKSAHGDTEKWERVESIRLICAMLLVLAVLLGKQVYPEIQSGIWNEILTVINYDTDFEAVFYRLGDALVEENNPLQGIGTFCAEVFGPQEIQSSDEVEPFLQSDVISPVGLLSEQLSASDVLGELVLKDVMQETTEQLSIETDAIPAVGCVLTVGKPPDSALPAGYTVDELSFGGLHTVTPVLGVLTSPFGYRTHPISGEYLFHGGADIGGEAGDDIMAFAAGTVDFVGEDTSYGLYFQLDHGSGIKSFYAHCERLYIKKGQRVSAGERVAAIGATGIATGPHLHLELKCGDLRVDPAYYIEFQET